MIDQEESEMSVSDVSKINDSLEMFGDHLDGMSVVSEEELLSMFGEGEEGGNLSDLGGEDDLDDALDDDEDEEDIVDSAIMELIDLVAQNYAEESAVDAVYDAVQSLVDTGVIDDMPSEIASDEEKFMWVQNNMPKIKSRLVDFGIELPRGAETVGGAEY